MSQPLFIVDAFAEKPFTGNPAAVCPLDGPAEESWMQSVAAEMNLSETAFLWPEADAFRLRWFTPAVEVALCGHATLASAHVLWETGRLAKGVMARFQTQSGLLTAEQVADGIQLDFPAKRLEAVAPPPGLLEALGTSASYVGKNAFDYFVEVDSEHALHSLTPDFARLKTFPVRGVIVTAKADEPRFGFVSRFFAPSAGVNEDPVTGSAHCALAPYWSAKLHKLELVGYQASARGGIVRVKVAGDRVLMSGGACTVVRGELLAQSHVQERGIHAASTKKPGRADNTEAD
jgi:PhzF family phenazine biosynthesis protein